MILGFYIHNNIGVPGDWFSSLNFKPPWDTTSPVLYHGYPRPLNLVYGYLDP